MKYHRTILHVNDDAEVTSTIGRELEQRGFQVTPLGDPAAVMEELTSSHYRFVLLAMDMPGLGGLDLLREIKAHDGSIQVVVMTDLASVQSVLQSSRWGAEACIFQPRKNMDLLLRTIERTFWKIDRWWDVIEWVAHEKRVREATFAK